jgi:hypothetical protein
VANRHILFRSVWWHLLSFAVYCKIFFQRKNTVEWDFICRCNHRRMLKFSDDHHYGRIHPIARCWTLWNQFHLRNQFRSISGTRSSCYSRVLTGIDWIPAIFGTASNSGIPFRNSFLSNSHAYCCGCRLISGISISGSAFRELVKLYQCGGGHLYWTMIEFTELDGTGSGGGTGSTMFSNAK